MTRLGNRSIQFMINNIDNMDKILNMSDNEILDELNCNTHNIEEAAYISENLNLTEKDISNIDKLIDTNKKIIEAIENKLDKCEVISSKYEDLEFYAAELERINHVLMLRSQNSIAKLMRLIIRNIYIFMRLFPLVSTIIYNIVGLSTASIATLFAMKAIAGNLVMTASAFMLTKVSIFVSLWFIVFNLGDYLIDKINIIGMNERDNLTQQKAKEIVRQGRELYKDAELKLKSLI